MVSVHQQLLAEKQDIISMVAMVINEKLKRKMTTWYDPHGNKSNLCQIKIDSAIVHVAVENRKIIFCYLNGVFVLGSLDY